MNPHPSQAKCFTDALQCFTEALQSLPEPSRSLLGELQAHQSPQNLGKSWKITWETSSAAGHHWKPVKSTA